MNIGSLLKNICAFTTTMLFTACSGVSIEGTWTEPVPGIEHLSQGIKIESEGKATSINMATLQYETWENKGDKLILTGKSIGNRQTLPFTDTLTIEKLTQDSLILNKGNYTLRYARVKEDQITETIPASIIVPAQKVSSVKGTLIIGHEVRSFVKEGDSVNYWINDETGDLIRKYDNLTKGTKNGTPVYAELEVIDMGKASEGFAAEYAGVYKVLKIINIKK